MPGTRFRTLDPRRRCRLNPYRRLAMHRRRLRNSSRDGRSASRRYCSDMRRLSPEPLALHRAIRLKALKKEQRERPLDWSAQARYVSFSRSSVLVQPELTFPHTDERAALVRALATRTEGAHCRRSRRSASLAVAVGPSLARFIEHLKRIQRRTCDFSVFVPRG